MRQARVFGWLLFLGCVALLSQASGVRAYDRYSKNRDATNCAACHGDFNSGSYVSMRDGVAWGTNLMAGHNSMMSSDCAACHQAASRFPVLINASDGGTKGFSAAGCVGCHGRTADAGHGANDGRGAGLRQHHDRSGVTLCRACHADANTTTPTYTPAAESVIPFNYFTPDANHPAKPTDACDTNGTESRYGATGLDNDGNGVCDGADAACRPTTTTMGGGTTTTMGGGTTTTVGGGTTTTVGGGTTTTVGGGTTTTMGGGTTTTMGGGTTTTMNVPTTTTLPDADDDGIPDSDDPCNNSGAHDITIKPKVMLKRLDAVANDDGLLIKGEFVSSTAFSNLDGDELRVIALRRDGTASFDIPISGAASVDTKRILFSDDTGSNNGITKFQVQDRSSKAPNQVKVLVKGKNGNYPVATGDEPIRVIVVIGDGSAGECGETVFSAGACTFNAAGNALKCR